MVQITKIGTGLIAGLIVVGFIVVPLVDNYNTNQTVKDLHPIVVVAPTVAQVSPTIEPTATPAATFKSVAPVKKPLTK